VRVIDAQGKNLGIISTEEALGKAKAAGLDLIEISPNAKPPVCKIMDYGKYKYLEEKKARESQKKAHTVEVRGVRVGIGTSKHDLEMKAKRASKFLEGGDRVKIDLILRGRAKYLNKDFINERLKRILDYIIIEHKIVEGPKKAPRGMYILIEREK